MHASMQNALAIERLLEVIKEQADAIKDIRNYAISGKYARSPENPMPTMNQDDIVLRTREWQNRILQVAENGRDVAEGTGGENVLNLLRDFADTKTGERIANELHDIL